jgi:predicted Fe-Mo cluster-binding NifX family protein
MMRIAVAYENGEIYGHFGHCPCFAIYEYGQEISDCTKVLVDSSDRQGHKAMADLMREKQVDAVLCGNMGPEAKSLLLSYGIIPVVGYCGNADMAADMLITGQLPGMGDDGGCGGNCGGCGGGCHHDDGGDCGCGGGCGCGK